MIQELRRNEMSLDAEVRVLARTVREALAHTSDPHHARNLEYALKQIGYLQEHIPGPQPREFGRYALWRWLERLERLTEREWAEEQARQNARKFADFVEGAVVALHWVGPDGIILWANQAELDLLGYPREEYVGQHVANFHDDPEVIADILRRLRAGETLHNQEARLRRKDGSIVHVLIDSNVLWEDGRFVHTQCFSRDITEWKRAEADYDRLFTLSLDLLCVAGFDGYFKRLNPAWEITLGFTLEELRSKPYLEFVHPDDREATRDRAREFAAGTNTVVFENRYRCKDGTYRWLSWNAVPCPDDSLVYAVARDITQLKEAVEALHKERDQLRTLIDNLPDYIYFKDAEGRFVINNTAHLRLLKARTQEDVVGTRDDHYFMKELAERYRADELAIRRTGQALTNHEEPVVDEAGLRKWVSTTKVPLRDETGTIFGLVGISRDITIRKRAEEALHDETHLIRWLDLVVNRMARCRTTVPQETADRLPELLRRANTVIRLVEGSARTTLNHMVGRAWTEPRPCNEAVRDWFANASWFIFDDAIQVAARSRLDDQPFWANPDEVLTSLLNLQTNATNGLVARGRERCGRGRPYRIVFSAEPRRLDDAPDLDATDLEYIVLSVADSGGGIREDIQKQIFQGRATGSDSGFGLGTQSVRRVMDNHRGLIRFASRIDTGTLVELWFPRLADPGSLPPHVQWKRYETIRDAIGPVRVIDDQALRAILNEAPR